MIAVLIIALVSATQFHGKVVGFIGKPRANVTINVNDINHTITDGNGDFIIDVPNAQGLIAKIHDRDLNDCNYDSIDLSSVVNLTLGNWTPSTVNLKGYVRIFNDKLELETMTDKRRRVFMQEIPNIL